VAPDAFGSAPTPLRRWRAKSFASALSRRDIVITETGFTFIRTECVDLKTKPFKYQLGLPNRGLH
jgi:hypothetical protein